MKDVKIISTEPLLSFKLQPKLKISANKIYAGIHFIERSKHKEYFSQYVKYSLPKNMPVIKDRRVYFSFTFHFKTRPFDSTNCSYMAKLIEDGLKNAGVIQDDSFKYVKGFEITLELNDEDFIIVEVYDAGEIIDIQRSRKDILKRRKK